MSSSSSKRKCLTFEQKKQIIEYHSKHPDLTQWQMVAWAKRHFKVRIGKSTVGRMLRNAIPDNLNMTRKRQTKVKFPEVENSVLKFVQSFEDKSVLTDEIISEKAKHVRDLLNIPETEFRVSNGWLTNFKRRHGFFLKNLRGEQPPRTTTLDESRRDEVRKDLSKILNHSEPMDIPSGPNDHPTGLVSSTSLDMEMDTDNGPNPGAGSGLGFAVDSPHASSLMAAHGGDSNTHSNAHHTTSELRFKPARMDSFTRSEFISDEAMNDFLKLRHELVLFDQSSELVRKRSVEISTFSKQAILSLHRNDREFAQTSIEKARKAILRIRPIVLKDLSHRIGAFSDALEEFAQASCLQSFLLSGGILPLKDIIMVNRNEYLAAVLNFTDDLARYAVQQGTQRRIQEVEKAKNLAEAIFGLFVEFNFQSSPLAKRLEKLKENVSKIEGTLYELSLAGAHSSADTSFVEERSTPLSSPYKEHEHKSATTTNETERQDAKTLLV